MKTYLVDFENIHSQGLLGIKDIPKEDRIIIFYTDSANNMTIDLHNEIMQSKAEIIFKKVYNGSPNALDFQLSSYLGYLISKDPKSKYIVVSKDAGYTAIIKFWKNEFNVSQIKNLNKEDEITEKEVTKPTKTINDEKITKEEVYNLIKDKSIDCNWIAQMINKYKTKTAINNAIVKKYKSEKAGIIYKAIKPLLKNKK